MTGTRTDAAFAKRLGANIRQARTSILPYRGVVWLAAKMGLTHQTISRWERGEIMPTTDKLPLLADLLEISIDDLLRG